MSDNNAMENVGKKLYYTISEVSRITGLKDSVLRSWDKDFPQLRPKRSSSGVRSYKTKDIELILYIKRLLHDEKYTVSGAKQRITEERRAERLNSSSASKREEPSYDDDQYQYEEREQPAPIREDLTAQSSDSTQPQGEPESSATPPELISNIRSEIVEILKIMES